MRRSNAVRLTALVTVFATSPAIAQPPTYGRWSGNNAIAPIQGNFNRGTPLELTWGFMALGTTITTSAGSAPNDLQTRLDVLYAGGQAVWLPLFQSVFDRWGSISGLSYRFEANDDGATMTNTTASPRGVLGTRADVRIGGKPVDGNGGVLASNFFPNHGDMVIDTNDNFYANTTNNSLRLRNVVSHEHGHGVGMPHVESNNAAFLMEPFINTSFDGPQYHDILAAHHLYGDAREKSNAGLGNDTAARANPLTLTAGSATVGTSARTFTVAAAATDFVSIDSSTDLDFYSFSVGDAGSVSVLLEALGFNYNVTAQGDGGGVGFDTRRRSDLRLGLFDTDGVTLLLEVDANGLGANELLEFDLAAGGTYYLRVAGIGNPDSILLDTQFYGLTITFVPVPEPAGLLLVAAAVGAGVARRRRKSAA